MAVITPDFIENVIRMGPLTEARRRVRDGTATPRENAHWPNFSAWALICEEILDTEHPDDWYDGVAVELERRGFMDDRIDAMRQFAWRTVGWLNFDKMLWEWVSLDEGDIRTALDWQLRERLIDRREYDEGLAFLANPGTAELGRS